MTEPHEVEILEHATATERDFLEALDRLVANSPNAPRLAVAARNGLIRPSQSTVAEEAGHSRTLISGSSSRFPRVQVEIRKAQDWYARTKRPASAVAALEGAEREAAFRRECSRVREERESLRRQRDAAYTSAAASTMLAQALNEAARRADVDIVKLRREAELKAIPRGLLSTL